jgi:BirA family transcriptional regulator, biotin operon repressor / biotin---[acetyl-CoA-carboxylase] ligase
MPLDIQAIQNLRPHNQVHYFPTIASTMKEATRLAASGAPHGTLVLADEQTAGIGRLGRTWVSELEVGIYCSIILRLNLPTAQLPIVSLLLGLATAEGIERSTHLVCDLRWPNDVLIQERKVAGIITQLVENCVVAGIGINANNTSLPSDVRTPATSLRIESGGRLQSRETVLVNLLDRLDAFCAMLTNEGPEAILRAFTSASSYALNRRVMVEESGAKGVTVGLDENGFLLVHFDSGQTERIATGGIRPI